MKKTLLDLLVCPSCLPHENKLVGRIQREEEGDMVEGVLECRRCGRSYPVREGIAFLDPRGEVAPPTESKYETPAVVSSYLWSHYGDLLGDGEASDAYRQWASLLSGTDGPAIDLGSAVGRFSFEMTTKSHFVVGIDNSVSFVRSARELMVRRRKGISLREEGNLSREETLVLRDDWRSDNVEFIVGDALALPFPSHTFSRLASLNLIDKVPLPLKHLQELNRVARSEGVELLLSDPFSWSTDVARPEDWLGGTQKGPFAGRGLDNVKALLGGKDGWIRPAWTPGGQGHIWWKIRTHANHFELIRSCYVKAAR